MWYVVNTMHQISRWIHICILFGFFTKIILLIHCIRNMNQCIQTGCRHGQSNCTVRLFFSLPDTFAFPILNSSHAFQFYSYAYTLNCSVSCTMHHALPVIQFNRIYQEFMLFTHFVFQTKMLQLTSTVIMSATIIFPILWKIATKP